MRLETNIRNRHFSFPDLKTVLGKANELRSGDVLAGVAAENSMERVAAKQVLADIPLWYIRENPVVPYEQDEITRMIEEDLDKPMFEQVRNLTVAELREIILAPENDGETLLALGRGLTSRSSSIIRVISSCS